LHQAGLNQLKINMMMHGTMKIKFTVESSAAKLRS